jgi:hypothetical protein
MRLCAAWRNTSVRRTTGTAPDEMMSASTCPGPTEGSWSMSPTRTRVQHIITNRRALAAVRTTIDRAVVVRLLTDPHAVRDLGDDRAADRAMGAHIPAGGELCACRRRGSCFCPAQTCERQCAQRCEAAAIRPERRKKLRRSRPPSDWCCRAAASAPRRVRSSDEHQRLFI